MNLLFKATLIAALMGFTFPTYGQSPGVLLEKGIYLQDTKRDYNEAIEVYESILKQEAETSIAAVAGLRLGQCYLEQGQNSKAAATFTDILQRYPEQTEIVRQIGELMPKATEPSLEISAEDGWRLFQKRDFKKGAEIFGQVVEKNPNDADAWNGYGWCLFNSGDSKTASTAFEKCLELNPEHPAALNGKGWLATRIGNDDEAIEWWNKAIKASPYATASLNGLAMVYEKRGEKEKLIETYEKWLEVDPDSQRIKTKLEEVRNAKEPQAIPALPADADVQRVIAAGNTYIKKQMDEIESRNESGHAYVDKTDFNGAWWVVKQLNPAEQVVDDWLEYLRAQAQFILENKKSPDGLMPDEPWRLYYLVAEVNRDRGKLEQAKEDYVQALNSYPEKDYSQPAQHSKYQHVANDLLLTLWDYEGQEVVEAMLLEMLEKETRFDYFFPNTLKRHYEEMGKTQDFKALLEKVQDAYDQRAKRFPRKEQQITEYKNLLAQELERL